MQAVNKVTKPACGPQEQILQGWKTLSGLDYNVSSEGDAPDWAETSKQINHINVNKSLTGRTGPDRQRLIGV